MKKEMCRCREVINPKLASVLSLVNLREEKYKFLDEPVLNKKMYRLGLVIFYPCMKD